MKKFRHLSCLLLCILFFSYAFKVYSQNAIPKWQETKIIQNGLYDKETLTRLRYSDNPNVQKRIKSLEENANKLLLTTHYPSVTDKKILLVKGETKHDFVSMTPYLWADNSKKNGYIVRDGIDNPLRLNNAMFDQTRLKKMLHAVNTLSFAYAITDKEIYAKQAVKYLQVWFIDPSTRMLPQMKYAEIFVPQNGRVYFSGSSMISAQPFLNIINAIYLLQGSSALSQADVHSLKKWFGEFNRWLLEENPGGVTRLRINNHGTWLQAELVTFGIFAGQTELANKALKTVGASVITPQIQASGKIPSALIRTKSVAYTEYNLNAFITLAYWGDKLGIPIWHYHSPDGGSILKAINYLNRYLLGKENWPYQNIHGKYVNATMTKQFIPYLALAYKKTKNHQYLRTIKKYQNSLNDIDYLLVETLIK